jgi:hypothetical protein
MEGGFSSSPDSLGLAYAITRTRENLLVERFSTPAMERTFSRLVSSRRKLSSSKNGEGLASKGVSWVLRRSVGLWKKTRHFCSRGNQEEAPGQPEDTSRKATPAREGARFARTRKPEKPARCSLLGRRAKPFVVRLSAARPSPTARRHPRRRACRARRRPRGCGALGARPARSPREATPPRGEATKPGAAPRERQSRQARHWRASLFVG